MKSIMKGIAYMMLMTVAAGFLTGVMTRRKKVKV